jgi:hypothetical protein
MISFNVKLIILKFFVGAIFIATALTAGKPGIALAQSSGGPISLVPPKELAAPDKSEAPKKLEKPQGSGIPALSLVPAPAPIPPQLGPAQRILQQIPLDSGLNPPVERPSLRGLTVEVNTLKLIDPDAVGVLEVEQGGFGENMWAGMGRETVDRLLPHFPVNTASWAMRDLMRRLLLSVASVPEGDGKGLSLVALRLKLLGAMGDLGGVDDLLKVAHNRDNVVALARLEADARLLSNDNARACQLTANQMGKSDDPYWQKVFVFCQALAGEGGKASLGADLLREVDDSDKIFFLLFDGLISSSPVTIESLSQPTPLQLAMARVVKADLPADVISSNEPSILRIIATSPNAGVSLRLEAAERAEAAGALSVDTLRQLYTSISFSEEDLANPLSRAEAESGPLSRALLYRTALVQTVPAAQAEAAAKAFSLAREGGDYASAVRVFLPVLKRIPATEDLLWFAQEAARAFLISREPDAAKAWFELMRTSAVINEEAKEKLTVLLPIARIAGSNEADSWGPEVLKVWRKAISTDEKANEKAVLLYSLLDVLGGPIPEEDWEELITGVQRSTVAMPHPAIWYRLATAAGQQQIGATVVLSLLALGEGGPAGADPIVLRQVLSGLRTAGLETEARAMALEAALAAGL